MDDILSKLKELETLSLTIRKYTLDIGIKLSS